MIRRIYINMCARIVRMPGAVYGGEEMDARGTANYSTMRRTYDIRTYMCTYSSHAWCDVRW